MITYIMGHPVLVRTIKAERLDSLNNNLSHITLTAFRSYHR